jgi:hypothetical protein
MEINIKGLKDKVWLDVKDDFSLENNIRLKVYLKNKVAKNRHLPYIDVLSHSEIIAWENLQAKAAYDKSKISPYSNTPYSDILSLSEIIAWENLLAGFTCEQSCNFEITATPKKKGGYR